MKRKVRLYLIGILSLGYAWVFVFLCSADALHCMLMVVAVDRAVAFGVTNGVFQLSFGRITDPYL